MMTLGFFFLNCKGDGVVTTWALYQGPLKFIKPHRHFGENESEK
jgi:hypothetical protein